MTPPRILVIGAGSRGNAYSEAMAASTNAQIVAVAEPIEYKRSVFGRTYIWGADGPQEGQAFANWRDFLGYELRRRELVAAGDESVPQEGVDGAFICVLDEMHREVVVGLAPLGLHIMCEKPLSTSLEDCLAMYRSISPGAVFSIGHVLRYSPHNMLLRKLLLSDRVIGDVISVEHTEPVGWWHFAHSYVRGNWRRESTTAPSLLTKSCHDMDVLLWLLCSPLKAGSGEFHLPATVSSTGGLYGYRKERKPAAAGNATNCLQCPLGDEGCKYSSKNIYVGPKNRGLEAMNTGWPVKIVLPEIEDMPNLASAKEALLAKLGEDYDVDTPDAEVASRPWYGRCVFESDNDVNDDQFVTMTWEDEGSKLGKQATLHMAASTKKLCDRYTFIYGTEGEIYADSATITVEDYNTGQKQKHTPKVELSGHGGGDTGLARQFVEAVDKVKNEKWEVTRAQNEIIGCTLEEVMRSHAMVFAAEEARKGAKVIRWREWWDEVSKERYPAGR